MKKIFLLMTAALMSVGMLSAQGLQQLPNDPAVRKGKLDNGLTYYIRHNGKPEGRAEFHLATNVGAIQETPDQDGLAHFLEHMCFNGTKNFPGKTLLEYLQSIGASFGGNVNAQTGVEQTTYMLNNIPLVRESVIDTCLLILHDYSHFVLNDPAEIDKERGVIIEERRARRNASWRMYEKSLPYYYGDSKYAGCTLIGSQENLENFRPESLVNFYKTWYRPDLQAVIVVGDIDVDKVEQKIKDIFSHIPAAVNPKAKEVIRIPDNKEPLIGIITDPEANSTSMVAFWKSEAVPEEYHSTVQGMLDALVKNILGLVMEERFNDISAKPDAPFLNASLEIGNLCESTEAAFGSISAREGEALPAFKAFLTEAEKMKRFGLSDAEIERAKTRILSQYESAAKKAGTRNNSQLVPELIDNFFDNNDYMAPEKRYELVGQLLPMIGKNVLDHLTTNVITDTNLVIVYNAPQKEGLTHPTEADFKGIISEVRASDIKANEAEEAMSELLDASKLKGSKVKKTAKGIYGSEVWTLKNGIRVHLLPTQYEKNAISIDMFREGGKSLIETEDLVSFDENVWTLFMRNAGVSAFPNRDLTKMLAGKNVSATPYIAELTNGISARTTPKDIETALQLMYLEYTDPRFDENEYNQAIKTINAVLPNLMSRPDYKMQKRMIGTMYGNNPRQRMIDSETMEKANLATIERVYRRLFSDAAGLNVIITGDFNPGEIRPLVEKYFGSISKGKKAPKWIDRNEDIVTGAVKEDFKEDMETPMTSVVNILTAPIEYNQDNLVAMNSASYIIDMRYVTSLREEEGGTYGASTSGSVNIAPKEYALFQIEYNSKPSMADKLHELAMKDLKALGESGPTEEEFNMAKKNLEKKLPEKRILNAYWAGAIRNNILFGKDTDKDHEAAVKALTPEKIRDIVKTLLSSGNMIEIVMRPGETAEAE